MAGLLPLAAVNMMWFALPLVVSISLVYSATRHEAMPSILSHSLRLGLMIGLFMVGIMALLALLSWQL
jgi:hypothetical protein